MLNVHEKYKKQWMMKTFYSRSWCRRRTRHPGLGRCEGERSTGRVEGGRPAFKHGFGSFHFASGDWHFKQYKSCKSTFLRHLMQINVFKIKTGMVKSSNLILTFFVKRLKKVNKLKYQ